MRAIISAAGEGGRPQFSDSIPKVLLKFGNETLLPRHIRILRHFGIECVDMTVGYRHEEVAAELERIGAGEPLIFLDDNFLILSG